MRIKLFHIKPSPALGNLKPKLILFFVALFFLAITLTLHFFIQSCESSYLAEIFRADAKQQVSVIENHINDQLERLSSLDNFFKNSEHVSKNEFHEYVNGWKENNGYTIFGWAPLITTDKLSALKLPTTEPEMITSQVHDWHQENINPQASPIYVLSYIDPLPKYSQLVGLNILSIPEINHATNDRKEPADTIVTSTFDLGDDAQKEKVVAILKPQILYAEGYASSSPTKGYLIELLNLKELLHHSQAEWITSSFIIKMIDISSKDVLYNYIPSDLTHQTSKYLLDHYQHILHVGNRVWQINIYPTENYYNLRDFSLTWAMIPTGIVLTLLIFLYMRSILQKQHDAEQIVKNKTIELKQKEARFSRLLENSKALIFRMSLPDLTYEYMSPAAKAITGYSAEDFLNDPSFVRNTFHPDSLNYYDGMMKRLLKGDVPDSYEFKIIDRSGSTRWIHQHNYLDCKNGVPIALEGVMTDITEQKIIEQNKFDLERKFFQRQKLESIGELAGGIAHDYNNLLFAIIGNIDLALNHTPPNSTVHNLLTKACDSAQRAANITKQLIAYAGKGKYSAKETSLSNLIEQSFELVSASVPNSISIRLDILKDIPKVQVDQEQVQQILINLIMNAAEACVNKTGNIVVSTGYGYFTEDYLKTPHQEEEQKPGQYCFIEVKDDGCGMDENTKNRLFEPFYTTKFFGRGLGMSAILGIVKSHGAVIKIESEPDKGTTIRVMFPTKFSAPEANQL